MSAMVSPLLWVRGKVRNVVPRDVPAVDPVEYRPAEYDDHGQIVRAEVPARAGKPGYQVHDVLIDTHRDGAVVPSGLMEVVITDKSAEATGGYLPQLGEDIDWPVRGYQKWIGTPGRRRSINAYSFAGDVYAAEQATSTTKAVRAAS